MKNTSVPNEEPHTDGSEISLEDALHYLDQVKQRFGNQPSAYNQFLNLMNDFKTGAIDTPGVITRVANLFCGHDDLIVGFNRFLPHGYSIRPETSAVCHATPGLSNARAVGHQGQTTNHRDQRTATNHVGFDHALHYITTIKQRFTDVPEIYQAFLAMLHTYRKEQKSIRWVLDEVSHLLHDHPDLLREFICFVPDAEQDQAKKRLNRAAEKAQLRKAASLLSGVFKFSNANAGGAVHQQDHRSNEGSGGRGDDSPSAAATKLPTTADTNPSDFEHAIRYVKMIKKRFANEPETYQQFLTMLDAYDKHNVSLRQVLDRVAHLFRAHADLVRAFAVFLPEEYVQFLADVSAVQQRGGVDRAAHSAEEIKVAPLIKAFKASL